MTPMCKTQYAVYWDCRCCQLVRSARHLRTSLLQWSTTTSGAARWMICFAMSGDSGCRSGRLVRNGAERTTSCAVSYWHFIVFFSHWIIGGFVISILLLFLCSCLSLNSTFRVNCLCVVLCCTCPSFSCPEFSHPAFSCLATWSFIFTSCIFMSCIFTQP